MEFESLSRMVGADILGLAMADLIIVVDYEPTSPERFQFLRRRIAGALGNAAMEIEHVGSTAVPNLVAKPIIDIAVLLAR